MCGIAGIVSRINVDLGQQVKKMTDVIAHRGPDGEGFYVDEKAGVALGHRRLAIIDLSRDADQPMISGDGRYIIMLNGEIYNYLEIKEELQKKGYQFRTKSDTEVLLTSYIDKKEKCLDDLDGMFAIVIYDSLEKKLFCARDRFGEKPFYYHYEEGRSFYFASEMKALWAAGIDRKVNERMLFNYLAFSYLENPDDKTETFYQNIRKLKAAHYLVLNTANGVIEKNEGYWKLAAAENANADLEETREKFADLFYHSVKRRLRSDVAVGSSLSGGLDSSLVVMTIDQIKKGTEQVQKTFSARFPGFAKDEGRYMQMVIDRCNVEPHFTYPGPDIILDHIEKVFYHQEEPFGSASICAQYEVMALTRNNNVTVLLDGQGADEILAGYHSYYPVYFTELKRSGSASYRQEVSAYSERFYDSNINPAVKKDLKFYLKKYANGNLSLVKKLKLDYLQLMHPEFNKHFYHEFRSANFASLPTAASLNEELLKSTTHVGLEQLLRYADRNSMAHSVEVRLPFLYHKMVEFLFSLPANFKIRDGWTKWIMRTTFENVLPEEIVWRKDKIGYEPPQSDWLKNKMFQELIFEKRKTLVDNGILHKKILQKKIGPENADQRDGNSWAHWMAGNLFS